MNKWEVARYLIDAKKNIDSIMYINKNIYELNNIDVSLKIRDVMQSFYLNLSYVLDEKYDTRDKNKVFVETIRLLRVYIMKEIKIRHTRIVIIKEQNMTQ